MVISPFSWANGCCHIRIGRQGREKDNLKNNYYLQITCISCANSYSSSVSTLTIIAFFSYSTASCKKNSYTLRGYPSTPNWIKQIKLVLHVHHNQLVQTISPLVNEYAFQWIKCINAIQNLGDPKLFITKATKYKKQTPVWYNQMPASNLRGYGSKSYLSFALLCIVIITYLRTVFLSLLGMRHHKVFRIYRPIFHNYNVHENYQQTFYLCIKCKFRIYRIYLSWWRWNWEFWASILLVHQMQNVSINDISRIYFPQKLS